MGEFLIASIFKANVENLAFQDGKKIRLTMGLCIINYSD
jgi:hypothetical protein